MMRYKDEDEDEEVRDEACLPGKETNAKVRWREE